MEYRNVKGIFFFSCMLASSHFTWVDDVPCLCALTVQYVYNIAASVHFESGLETCNMRARSLRDNLLGRVTVELHAFILHPDRKLIAQHDMLTTETTVAREVNEVNGWLVLYEYVGKTLCVEILNNCPRTDVVLSDAICHQKYIFL